MISIRSPYLLAAAALVLAGAWAPAFSTPDGAESNDTTTAISATGNRALGSTADTGVILIEGTGNPGEGWVEFAPLGSHATGPSGGKGDPDLVRLPFSVLGHTKILINMDHAQWVYSVGQPTEITNLSHTRSGDRIEAAPPILVTQGNGEGFLEFVGTDGQTMNLPSQEDYLFPQEGFRYIKLPKGSSVQLLD